MIIEWADPPREAVERQRKTAYTDLVAALKENAGRWALVPGERTSGKSAANLAQSIRRGVMKDFAPKGAFDAVHDDDAKVYVRYVGAPAASDEGTEPEAGGASNGAIREWAKANGFPDLPERGRLPEEVHAAYRAAKLQTA